MVLAAENQTAKRALPPGWRWARLGELIVEARNGLYKPDEYYGRGTPILKMFNIGRLNGQWNRERVDLIQLDPEEQSAYCLAPGDILVNRVNSRELVGKCAVVGAEVAGAAFESKNMRLRLDPKTADPLFTASWLNSAGGRDQMAECLKQIVGQATVNRTDLNALWVPLPPLAEQKRIAAILNEQMAAVERARAAAEAQLEAAKALPAAYLRAVFSSPEAQQWPMRELGDLCEIQLGKMLSPASRTGLRPRPYLRNANVQWGRFDLADISKMDFTEEQERKFALRPGDLLVCEGGEPGRAAVWEGQIPSCLYQKAIHRLRPINNTIDPRFVMYRLWMGALQQEFVESHAKTTIAHLPAVRLQRLPVRVPSLSEQQRLAVVLNEHMSLAERTRKAIEEELDAIDKLPAALLRRVFNGEL